MAYLTEEQDAIVCPYCRYWFDCSSEYIDYEGETECENCQKIFSLVVYIEVRYSTIALYDYKNMTLEDKKEAVRKEQSKPFVYIENEKEFDRCVKNQTYNNHKEKLAGYDILEAYSQYTKDNEEDFKYYERRYYEDLLEKTRRGQ